jgi:hypothetical protein
VNGENVLAIHGLGSGIVDNDLLILPELESVQLLGGISPRATLYTGPININDNQRIVARAFDGSRWSGVTDSTFVVFAPTLRVSELHYHPADPTPDEYAAGFTDADDFEFIELINTGTNAINLSGTSLADGVQFTFGDETLAAGERIIVAANQAAFSHRYGPNIRVAGEYGLVPERYRLNNSGERIVLRGPQLEPVHSFVYDDAWQPATDGAGYSLVALDLNSPDTTTWDHADGWRTSFELGGSPGQVDRMLGDLNGDYRVDLVDLIAVQNHFGTSVGATLANGDANGDGTVNRADAAVVAASFGRAYPPQVATSSAAALATTTERVAAFHAPTRYPALRYRRGAIGDAIVAVDGVWSGDDAAWDANALRAARTRHVAEVRTPRAVARR